MKRSISLVLVLVLLLSVLSGCTTGTDDASGDDLYIAGTYKGKAEGHNGPIEVEVKVDAKEIKSVEVLGHEESAGVADPALERIPERIVEDQSLAVDAVAGATFTSNGILEAVEEALKEAGADIAALKVAGDKEEKVGEKLTMEADLVVVGGGIAGLAATLEASDNGAENIILLEKMPAVGGSTIRSDGKMLAAGTDIQKKLGIEDSPELFAEFLMEIGEYEVDEDFINLIANNSAANIEWLIDYGVELSDEVEPLHSYRKPARGHMPANDSGSGLTMPLEAEIKSRGIEILYETPAISLIEENGEIVGVIAENSDGDEITINTKAVILATGGFSRNEEMVKEYYPSAGEFTTGVGEGNFGDGITMAKEVGADLVMPDGGINMTLDRTGTYYGYGEEATGLFVTPDGERFMDEKDFHFKRTRELMDTGYDNCWYVFDEKTFNDRVAGAIEAGGAVEAGSIEELAEKMGVDADSLKETVDEYNEMSKNGEDTRYGKAAEYMIPIEEGDFYAVHMKMHNSGTHGGVKINIDAEAIDTEGNVIPGLYAAGEVASGQILYKEYPGSGTAIMSFLTFGRQAGAAAAKFVK